MCQSSKELQELQAMLTPPNIIAESDYSAVWKGQPSNVQAQRELKVPRQGS